MKLTGIIEIKNVKKGTSRYSIPPEIKLNYIFVRPGSGHYSQAVNIRISLFFQEIENPYKLIHDEHENDSFHLVALNDNEDVLGTGRLTMHHLTGIISQMAISEKVQRQNIGTEIMRIFITKCIDLELNKIELSARKSAVKFYEKFGFNKVGPEYPSIKTGIPHQKMIKSLDSERI